MTLLRGLWLCCFCICAFANTFSQTLTSITPDSGCRGTNFSVTITGTGTNWIQTNYSYINVYFSGTGVTAYAPFNILNTKTITSNVDVANNAPIGNYTPSVYFNDGFGNITTSSLPNGFKVSASSIAAINPDSGKEDTTFSVTISGTCTNWLKTIYSYVNVSFSGNGISVNADSIISQKLVFADITIANSGALGLHDVMVSYYNGTGMPRIDTLVDGFEVIKDIGVKELGSPENLITIYPNPFHGSIQLQYQLNQPSDIFVEIFDPIYKRIWKLKSTSYSTGNHNLHIPGSAFGSTEGIYFISVTINDHPYIFKVVRFK